MSFQSLASVPDPSSSQTPASPVVAPKPVFCFSIQAAAEPGVMPRVLELFAKRGLVPRRWVSDARWVSDGSGPGGRDLSIDLQIDGVSPESSAYMARCLRQIWGVTSVLTSEKSRG